MKTVQSRKSQLSSCVVTCLAFIMLSTEVFAVSGASWDTRGNDLLISVNGRWIGTHQGGYHPLRIRITNRGPDRELTVIFSSMGSYQKLPQVRRSVQVVQNATVEFSLLIPLVSAGNYGQFEVISNGSRLSSHSQGISLSAFDPNKVDDPALLVISQGKTDCAEFEAAISSMPSTTSAYGGRSGINENHLVVEPSMLPDTWLGYSGVDMVAIPLNSFTSLKAEERAALLNWTHTGGNLILYNVKENITTSQNLRDALQISAAEQQSISWMTLLINKRRVIQRVNRDDYGNIVKPRPGSVKPNLPKQNSSVSFQWKTGKEEIGYRPLIQGRVYAFRNSPFPGTLHEWSWLMKSLRRERYSWSRRSGIAPRSYNTDFLAFRIPDVQGVPVYSFLVLITVFTIVIGPLNYFFLWRRKQLYLLVVSIPIIALVTSLSLLGYSVVAHGFGIKSRLRSVTFLDQNRKVAVSNGRLALFAGLSPSSGLQYSSQTAVYPIWHNNDEFNSGSLNWSELQAYSPGWIRSRTRTQFMLTEHRTERRRLNIKSLNNGKLEVGNGFDWDIEALVVADDQGNLFYGEDLSKDSSKQLTSATDLHDFVDILKNRSPLKNPEGFDTDRNYGLFNFSSYSRHYGYHSEQYYAIYASCQMERQISDMIRRFSFLNSGRKLPKSAQPNNTYYAILKNNPDIGIGLENTNERGGYHVLVGRY